MNILDTKLFMKNRDILIFPMDPMMAEEKENRETKTGLSFS